MAKKVLIDDRVSAYLADVAKLRKKHRLQVEFCTMFPDHARPPFIGRLALILLSAAGGKLGEKYLIKSR